MGWRIPSFFTAFITSMILFVAVCAPLTYFTDAGTMHTYLITLSVLSTFVYIAVMYVILCRDISKGCHLLKSYERRLKAEEESMQKQEAYKAFDAQINVNTNSDRVPLRESSPVADLSDESEDEGGRWTWELGPTESGVFPPNKNNNNNAPDNNNNSIENKRRGSTTTIANKAYTPIESRFYTKEISTLFYALSILRRESEKMQYYLTDTKTRCEDAKQQALREAQERTQQEALTYSFHTIATPLDELGEAEALRPEERIEYNNKINNNNSIKAPVARNPQDWDAWEPSTPETRRKGGDVNHSPY